MPNSATRRKTITYNEFNQLRLPFDLLRFDSSVFGFGQLISEVKNRFIGEKNQSRAVMVEVYNDGGVLLKSESHVGKDFFVLDLGNYPEGIYLIQLLHNNCMLQKKVVKVQ